MKTTTVKTPKGDWQVRLKENGELQIVDDQGRERHRSRGHIMTGVHLAMMLSEHSHLVEKHPNLDKALKMAVAQFENE